MSTDLLVYVIICLKKFTILSKQQPRDILQNSCSEIFRKILRKHLRSSLLFTYVGGCRTLLQQFFTEYLLATASCLSPKAQTKSDKEALKTV